MCTTCRRERAYQYQYEEEAGAGGDPADFTQYPAVHSDAVTSVASAGKLCLSGSKDKVSTIAICSNCAVA